MNREQPFPGSPGQHIDGTIRRQGDYHVLRLKSVTDRLVKHIHVRGPDKRTHAGDLDFYRQQLFNKGITPTPIGHSDLTCTNTGTGSMNCSGTYFLPKGKIMVGGVIASRLFYELAVMGGTGIYDNVRGNVVATFLGGVPAREFLLFRLGI